MGVARLAWWVVGADPVAPRRLELAVNAGYSHDEAVNLPALDPSFHGRRTLWGADFRYSDGRWLIAAEAIGSRAWPTGAVQVRLEDAVDPDQPGVEHHRFLFGGQFGF